MTTTYTKENQKNIDFSPLKMATQPKCGRLTSTSFSNFNTGIDLSQILVSEVHGPSLFDYDRWMRQKN